MRIPSGLYTFIVFDFPRFGKTLPPAEGLKVMGQKFSLHHKIRDFAVYTALCFKLLHTPRSEEGGTGACRALRAKQAGATSETARSAKRDYASFPESGACRALWAKQAGATSETAKSAKRDYASFPESGACRALRAKQAGGTSETARETRSAEARGTGGEFRFSPQAPLNSPSPLQTIRAAALNPWG